MMTAEQRSRIEWFKTLDYKPRILKRAAHGIIIVAVPCKLTDDVMPMQVHPDGAYMPPWYIQRQHGKERAH